LPLAEIFYMQGTNGRYDSKLRKTLKYKLGLLSSCSSRTITNLHFAHVPRVILTTSTDIMLRQTLLRRAAAPSRFFNLQTPSVLSSVPFCRRITTSTDSSPSTPPPTSPADLPAFTSTQSTPAARPPYLVSRTPSLFLPVYQDTKRGGNKKLTVLKKIEGDVRALKEDLKTELKLEDGQIKINHVTGHIEIVVSNFLSQAKSRKRSSWAGQ
jgi:large subunit ribosomal protein L49